METKEQSKIILISCWAKPLRSGGWNAKNPSKEWWNKITKLLKDKGYDIWQCGQGAEIKLKFIDRHLWDKDLWALAEDIKNCVTWISVDNFFHHFALLQVKKPGFVIWSQSDPEIFGHKENFNLLKDKKYLRPKQFEMWEQATYDKDAFVEPEDVIKAIEDSINTMGEQR
jgi:ADP-heptose:LPS heptosyltransferase